MKDKDKKTFKNPSRCELNTVWLMFNYSQKTRFLRERKLTESHMETTLL